MYDALLQALGFAGNVLDTPGSVARGIGSAGVRGVRRLLGEEEQGELATRDLGRAFSGITDPSQRVMGEEWTGDPWSGMAADIATDPTNIFAGLGLLKGMKAAKLAKVSNAKRAELLASGGMPEEIAKLTKVVDEGGKPLRTYHGTGDVFDKYDMAKANPASLYGKGIYTTADPAIASTYAENAVKSGWNWKSGALPDKYVDELPPLVDPRNGLLYTDMDYLRKLANDDPSAFKDTMYAFQQSIQPEPYLGKLETLMEPYHSGTVNVRGNFIDARNPLNLDSSPQIESLRSSAAEVARGQGYDAMMHTGGKAIMGGKPHQVVIALDPSQIYSPWIAPAAQRVPRQSPLLAALLGYNTAARGDANL